MKMRNILYTTDFSESAKSAFGLAYSLAQDHGARLIVLHSDPRRDVRDRQPRAARPRRKCPGVRGGRKARPSAPKASR